MRAHTREATTWGRIMQDISGFTPEEIAELRKLLDIERIRKVANLYSHYQDGRDFDGLASLYAEDAVCDWGPDGTWVGRAKIAAALRGSYVGRQPYDGLHVTTNHWIELTGPDSARSRSYLTDAVLIDKSGPMNHPGFPANPILLYALYENEYRRVDAEWQISRSVIHFLWSKRVTQEGFPDPMPASAIG